ncbi:YjcG family protein [Planococcus shenhongbingii]|uniref:Putative phosphoesterase QWY13_02665 n=1 Tax=Planococcus shenhongbingii TaxID=3058398 RepID=A0ABT8N932_9BACL|nr:MULTISPECIES: YjcG family protein [unclassified Planococcus (in: firmicutes)]MDN7244381.1 YjcG family protein [Planococcus sp. N017]WKA57547.1 YjcG family protein [Planococcus sp. N016]
MKFGVVAFPSKKLQDVANSYRKRYDPHYELITPHMTLKDAFEVEETQIKDMVKNLAEIVKRHKPFQLHATRVSTFSPLTNTLYFKIEPNPEILSLHEDLHKDFYGNQPKYSYVPHVTIAQKMSDSEHADIFGQLKMVGINHEETIDRIHLLYQLEDGSWTVYDTFRLPGDDQ